jgi:DNA-binding beta-propeller fold protein YncE
VYVADAGNARVEKFDPAGKLLANWSNSISAFQHPDSVAVDAQGNVYVADEQSRNVDKLSPSGLPLKEWFFGIGVGHDMREGHALREGPISHMRHVRFQAEALLLTGGSG